MAWRCGSLPRSLISTARSSAIRRSTTTPLRPPLSGPRIRPGPTPSIPSFRTIGGVIGCTQSLLPLHSVVAAARLTCHISVQARACCELSQVALNSVVSGAGIVDSSVLVLDVASGSFVQALHKHRVAL
ncbi:hypothetical protein Tco_0607575 [Tanacetum coccineum]